MPTDLLDVPTVMGRKRSGEMTTAPHRAQDLLTMPGELEALARELRVIAEAYGDVAARLMLPANSRTSITDRYRHAAATWPVVPAPSYERLATLLSGLYEAADAARRSAGCGDLVKETLDAALAGQRRRDLCP